MFEGQSYSRGNFVANSKETVVLCRWESETWKLSFIKRVDKGRISSERNGLTLETSALQIFHCGNSAQLVW